MISRLNFLRYEKLYHLNFDARKKGNVTMMDCTDWRLIKSVERLGEINFKLDIPAQGFCLG